MPGSAQARASHRMGRMLCVYRIHQPIDRPVSASAQEDDPHRRVRLKVGPLWKLEHVVEPPPQPLNALALLDEKSELVTLDGPFAETKA